MAIAWTEVALIRELRVRGRSLRTLAHAFGRALNTITKYVRAVSARLAVRRVFRTVRFERERAKRHRKARTDAGFCLNAWSHGKATHGVRCSDCHLVHSAS